MVRECIAFCLIGMAQAAPAQGLQAADWPGLPQAIQEVKKTGAPLVVVATSSASAESAALVASIKESIASGAINGRALFAEMPVETYAERLKGLGVGRFPTVLIYRSGPKGLVAVGHKEIASGAEVGSWLRTLGLLALKPAADRSLVKTGGHGSGQTPYPSGQGEYIPPPAPAPPPYAPPAYPQPVYAPQPVMAPVYTQPAPQPVVVSAPSAPVVFQPQAPTIVVGPTPQPNIVFANAPASAPNVSYVNAGNAPTANAPQQFFLAPAPTANAPSAPPPMAYAPSAPPPMQYAPQYAPPMMAYAPQAPQMAYAPAPTGNSPLLAAAILTNPRLWERVIGALGEHLAQKKNPRVQMGSAPTLAQAPMAYAPTAGAPMAYAPVAPQPMYAAPAQQPMYMPAGPPMYGYGYGYGYGPPPGPPAYQQPPPPQGPSGPSPQSDGAGQAYPVAPGKTGFFHRFSGR